MAVEEDGGVRDEELEEREAGAELVDEEGGWAEEREFGGKETDLEDEVELAKDGAQDGEAPEERGGD